MGKIRSLWQRALELFQVRKFVRLMPSSIFGRVVFPRMDIRSLTDKGYRKNLIVYRCIREIAESAAEPTIAVKRRGQFNPLTIRHPLVKLLEKPNPDQSTFSFIESLVTYQQASGNWYIVILRNGFGLPVQLWPVRPDRMEVVPMKDGTGIERYDYRLDGMGPAQPFPAEDVIHDRLIDPLDDYYGLSPIEVASGTVDLDNDAINYLRQFFLNSATPTGIVKVTQQLTTQQRREIREAWEEQYLGPSRWHSVAVLDQDADYKPVGFPLKDLSLEHVFTESESRICGAFGVPPILIGAKLGLDRSTFANYAEARRSFWIETLKPIYRRIADRLTFSLAPEFGPDLVIDFDYAGVGALQEDKESIRKTAVLGWDKGILTRNEARSIIGWPQVAGGDIYKGSQQDAFTPQGEQPITPEPGNRIPANVGNGDGS